jgi:peptidoglycan-associated lipoprotein
MLLRRFGILATALFATLATVSCTDDEKKQEEAVQPSGTADAGDVPPVSSGSLNAETIYFAFDDYTLNQDAQSKLNTFADGLKASQGAAVQIEGHCDERGSIEYNLALGERRANSVKNYLTRLGIDPARLSTISYGEEKPRADGHDESAWSQNRRAEFVVSGQ